ncbi:MAG: hypothetical protein F6K09_06575, partial [Merismopedia sp. SIO2A8]|nr:hypothetical protein [Merismopedia sp. SIO2A8]
MEVVELKFLLALLGHPPDYYTALSALRPTESRSDRNRACRQLCDRGLVDCSEDIIQFKTSKSGTALLQMVQMDTHTVPITSKELKLLKAGVDDWTTPGKALKGVAAKTRQALLREMKARGLIQAESQVKDVWLTPSGRMYLLKDCNPSGNHTVSFNFLHNYINFLRNEVGRGYPADGHGAELHWTKADKPTVEDVFGVLQTLDQQLNTNNYLPLFHLRQVVQPPLSREELDQQLYELQRQDKIELSSLQDAIA